MEKKSEQRSRSPAFDPNRSRSSFSQSLLRQGDIDVEEDPRPSSSFFSESERCSSAQSDASSWAEEGEGSRRGWLLLQRLTEGLYSDDPKLPGQLGEECELWRKSFPHFRVEGHAMTVPPVESLQSRPDSPTAEEEQVFASHGTIPP